MDKFMSVGECSTVTEVKRQISSEIIVSMRLKWFERRGLDLSDWRQEGSTDFWRRMRKKHAAVP